MLLTHSGLRGKPVAARDGEAGTVADLLFDDRRFTVRWVVVDTGAWLPGRKVLLPPAAFERPEPPIERLSADVSQADVEAAPGIDVDAPVSRQHEADLFAHYRFTPYWAIGGAAVGTAAPETVPPAATGVPDVEPVTREPTGAAAIETGGDPDLRSADEVAGYHIHATDGFVGHVADLLIAPDDWRVRWLVVDTRDFLPGRRVLLSPDWVRSFGWADREVLVDVSRETVREAPPYEPAQGADRDLEDRLYRHYGFPPYYV